MVVAANPNAINLYALTFIFYSFLRKNASLMNKSISNSMY